MPSHTPTQIADDTNAMMSAPFRLITFKELVRIACEYESGSGQELFDGISDTRRQLCEYFRTRPQMKEVFQQVEHPHCTEYSLLTLYQILGSLIPPAVWAVSTSLLCPDDDLHPSGALEFILPRIRNIFQSTDLSLDTRMEKLEALEVQYVGIVHRKGYSRWGELLHADLSPGSRYVNPNSPTWDIIKTRQRLSRRAGSIMARQKANGRGC